MNIGLMLGRNLKATETPIRHRARPPFLTDFNISPRAGCPALPMRTKGTVPHAPSPVSGQYFFTTSYFFCSAYFLSGVKATTFEFSLDLGAAV